MDNSVRIIGGKLRSRKIVFPDAPGLRPTHDRIRETLFNWLAPMIVGSTCFDLFAGSGALGFEALSRGASFVTFVDNEPKVIQCLQENADKFNLHEEVHILRGQVPSAISGLPFPKYDIVFLDPPYQQGLIMPTLEWLLTNQYMADDGLIYIETEIGVNILDNLPLTLHVIKQKYTKTIQYFLLKV